MFDPPHLDPIFSEAKNKIFWKSFNLLLLAIIVAISSNQWLLKLMVAPKYGISQL